MLVIAAQLLLLLLTAFTGFTNVTPEWMSDKDDEILPTGVTRVRDRFVAGFARPHAELCREQGARTRLVVLVASASANKKRRDAVRRTWGHVALRTDIAFGFMLGEPTPDLRAALNAEDALYGDLIQGINVDTYKNLTLKTLSMLEWFISYCPLAARLLKTDDDVFINIDGLLRFAEAPERRQATLTVWGLILNGSRPFRDPTLRYYMPSEEFPDEFYPPYASGGAYLMSGDATSALLRSALSARFLHLEDALVTGVAAERAGVARVNEFRFYSDPAEVTNTCVLRFALTVYDVAYADQFDMWRRLHDPAIKC